MVQEQIQEAVRRGLESTCKSVTPGSGLIIPDGSPAEMAERAARVAAEYVFELWAHTPGLGQTGPFTPSPADRPEPVARRYEYQITLDGDPASRLHEAADWLELRAGKAAELPWSLSDSELAVVDSRQKVVGHFQGSHGASGTDSAGYAAAMGPQVGQPLADLLRAVAKLSWTAHGVADVARHAMDVTRSLERAQREQDS